MSFCRLRKKAILGGSALAAAGRLLNGRGRQASRDHSVSGSWQDWADAEPSFESAPI